MLFRGGRSRLVWGQMVFTRDRQCNTQGRRSCHFLAHPKPRSRTPSQGPVAYLWPMTVEEKEVFRRSKASLEWPRSICGETKKYKDRGILVRLIYWVRGTC
jgi:hypothetical protein